MHFSMLTKVFAKGTAKQQHRFSVLQDEYGQGDQTSSFAHTCPLFTFSTGVSGEEFKIYENVRVFSWDRNHMLISTDALHRILRYFVDRHYCQGTALWEGLARHSNTHREQSYQHWTQNAKTKVQLHRRTAKKKVPTKVLEISKLTRTLKKQNKSCAW